MKALLLVCLIILFIPVGAQDSVWIKKDLEAFSIASPMETYEEAIAHMVNYFGPRRANGPITKELANNYRLTANWYKKIGKYQPAINYIDTAIQLQQELPDLPLLDQAKTEYNYGQIFGRLNLLGPSQYWHDKALSSLTAAIAAGDSSRSRQNMLQYYTNSSSILAARNLNFAKADLLHKSFADLFAVYAPQLNSTTAKLNLTENIMSRGMALQRQGRFADAKDVYSEAFTSSFTEETGNKNIVLNLKIIRGNYTNTLLDGGEFAQAEPLVREVLDDMLAENSNDPQFWDRTLITYGYLLNALQGQGKYAEMPTLYADAITLRYQIDSTEKGRNLGLINTFMGEAASKQGDFAAAADFFAKARFNFVSDATPWGSARLPRIHRNQVYGQEEFLYFLQAYREAFVREADAGNPEALDHALATARSIDSLLQRGVAQLSLTASVGGFLQLENRHYQRGIDLALRLYRERGNQDYLAEAFRFASVQKANLLRRYLGAQELATSFGVPQDRIGEKIRLETNVLILEQALADNPGDRASELRQQLLGDQQALAEIRRELERDYPNFGRAIRGASLPAPFAAAADLEADQQVVEYFLGQDSIYLFSLTAAKGLTYAVVPRPKDLDEQIANTLTDTSAAATLYQLLVAPVAPQMNPPTRLQLIPDGILWEVPFQALRVKGQYLIYRRAVSYAYSSAGLFSSQGSAGSSGTYLGYGISYDNVMQRINTAANRSGTDVRLRNMGSLPYARQEVQYVAGLLDATPVPEEQATKAHFFSKAPKAGILHLAMHGIREDNPMESALVFPSSTDDSYALLRMQELLGKQFPARLTVLSACHSGNGPLEAAEGRQSIGRAFAAAGSQAIITSNWAAPDRATNVIIQEAFTQIQEGFPTDVALQQGILRYLGESSAAERMPKNWAHLSLTGSTLPVHQQGSWKQLLFPLAFMVLLLGRTWYKQRVGTRQNIV